ncbi:MAG: Rieske (2Fe-2S) protein [Gemmatimonadaceae bacterium]|jgi:nitrite reductase/ring-hydroxylating ferredoxin subunit|nr:Rieske (2Fe-2S) protein [Gemmatimonadaceae bacterium]
MSANDCSGDCPIARRVFLKDVSVFTAALVAAGLAPRGAMAAATPVAALSRERTEVRYPIPPKDGVQFDDKNEVIIVRNAGKVYAFALSCPHQNTALKLDPAGTGGFYCTKHESRYRPTGEFISGRATRNMDRLVIRRDGNAVVVDVDKWFESDSEPAQWAAAVVTL